MSTTENNTALIERDYVATTTRRRHDGILCGNGYGSGLTGYPTLICAFNFDRQLGSPIEFQGGEGDENEEIFDFRGEV